MSANILSCKELSLPPGRREASEDSLANPNVAEQHFVFFSSEIVVFFRYQLFQYMADEGAETPTVLPKIDFHFVLQTAASDISTT